MRELDLVGLSDDRRHVLLRDTSGGDSGEDFRVLVDDRLHAAFRGAMTHASADSESLEQVERPMDKAAALRPRDIQARIRAGESPEAVAAVAQVPVERIMGYAVPVLAEREHVCEQARRSGLRRKHASGPGRLLGQVVDEQLRSTGLDPGSAAWDSWRRDETRWSVTVTASRNGEPATFLFDVPGRYVVAHDDGARRLVGDEPPLSVEPEADEPRTGLPRVARLYRGDDEEIPDVSPALSPELAALDAEVAVQTPPKSRVSALDRLRRQRNQVADELPHPAAQPAEQSAEATGDADVEAIARVMSGDAPDRPVAVGESRRRKNRRASVPSWDEIMFGSKPQP